MLEKTLKKFKKYKLLKKDSYNLKIKKEMCESAIKSRTCPNACYSCAWNTNPIKSDEEKIKKLIVDLEDDGK